MQPNTEHKQENLDKLNELMQGMRNAMLTTLDQMGEMRSRPMVNLDRKFDGTLWFFTRPSPKANEIEFDQRVNVTFSDPRAQTYVSLTGVGSVVEDKGIARQLWSPLLKPWFPGGPDDPELVLLKINVTAAEYWDSNVSRMVQLFSYIKAAVTGKRLDGDELGESNKVDLTGGR
jgi:general stress protein 26